MKLLVETKDNLQVVGTGEELHAHHNRPSVVRSGGFMQTHVSAGNLIMLAQLEDEASDAEFRKRWNAAKSDEDKAKVKAEFAAEFAPEGAKPKNTPK